ARFLSGDRTPASSSRLRDRFPRLASRFLRLHERIDLRLELIRVVLHRRANAMAAGRREERHLGRPRFRSRPVAAPGRSSVGQRAQTSPAQRNLSLIDERLLALLVEHLPEMTRDGLAPAEVSAVEDLPRPRDRSGKTVPYAARLLRIEVIRRVE